MTASEGAPQAFTRLLRACWPLPGALTGAAVAFHLYFRQPGLNTDTAAPLFAASLWAGIGLFSGALISLGAAGLISKGLVSALGGRPPLRAGIALLVVAVLCRSLYAPLELRLPALLWPKGQPAAPDPTAHELRGSACDGPPPSATEVRRAWDLECR